MHSGYDVIRYTMERLAAEGVSPDWLADVEAQMVQRLARAQRDRKAAELLPRGPTTAAEILGVCRASVYKMARRHRKSTKTRIA